jgi:hypothetical protein
MSKQAFTIEIRDSNNAEKHTDKPVLFLKTAQVFCFYTY